ncbi:hypothetical protein [Roseibium sp.]|uniref:hypothetical protein n=1 Tax=Roseibium sp. TaxID=1936156 RepID=UPI003A974BED
MLKLIDRLPLTGLVVFAAIVALAPFVPEPHLIEKLRMLSQGHLTKPIDIFDLFWHSWPFAIVGLKLWRIRRTGKY